MQLENDSQNKTVQTLAEDMAEAIQDSQGGLIKKIISEEEDRERNTAIRSIDARKNQFFFIVSLLLLVTAFILVYVFVISKEEPKEMPVAVQFTPLIFTDKYSFVELTLPSKEDFVSSVLKEFNTLDVKKGGVLAVYPTENKKVMGFSRFLKVIKSSLVILEPNPFYESFMIGALRGDKKDLFLLLKIKSFTDVFNDARLWEEKMFDDLHDFFGVDVNASTNYLLTKDFEDGIIQNKNARILRSDKGEIVLMYVFIDETSIIITNTESVTREVMLRLDSSKIKR